MDPVKFRPAASEDARFLTPLVAESSGGVWPAVWKALAGENETAEAYGVKYLADPANDLSLKNTVVAEADGRRIGAMIFYREGHASMNEADSGMRPALPAELTDALRPYRELSDPESLFIAEICFLPEARGKGLGTRLLQYALDAAIEAGLPRVTLRVFSLNQGAVRLYQRIGFEIVGERPVIPHPDIRVAGSVYLMSYAL